MYVLKYLYFLITELSFHLSQPLACLLHSMNHNFPFYVSYVLPAP